MKFILSILPSSCDHLYQTSIWLNTKQDSHIKLNSIKLNCIRL